MGKGDGYVLINETNLSVRSQNALKNAGYNTIEEIKNLTKDELDNISNLGKKSVDEISEFLNIPSNNRINLSVRSRNALKNAGYSSDEEIKSLTENELKNIRNLGEKSIEEILNLKLNKSNENYSYKLHSSNYHRIKEKKIELLEMDNTYNKLLKNNNIQTVGVFLELKKSDIKKFRDINENQMYELKKLINKIRADLNLNYKDFHRVVSSNFRERIKDSVINILPSIDREEEVQFYFKSGESFKKSIDVSCIELKESDVKKIQELELNKIDKLINIIPKDLEKIKGMNEKKINRILNVLLKKLILIKDKEILLENLAHNYLRNQGYNFWLNMEDDVINTISEKITEIINKYVDVYNHGFKELSYFINHHNNINKEFKEIEFTTKETNEVVYRYLMKYSKKMTYKSLIKEFENVNTKLNFVSTVNNLMKNGLIDIENDKVITFKKSVLHYAKLLKSENQYEALKLRLKNFTLQEVGNEIGLTRERARQLINQALNYLPKNVVEANNVYWFENYKLDHQIYNYLFDDNAYTYLTLTSSEGHEDWTAILNDEKADDYLKRKINNKLQENRIILDEISIPKNRTAILKYLIRNYCEDVTTQNELEELYNLFLDEHVSNQDGLEIENRYIETRISEQGIIVERPKKCFRFYDYNEYDWQAFYKELGLIEWRDMDLSTEIIFNANKKLMDDYNILNKYELHNIMKRTKNFYNEIKLKFGRTPHLIIGEGNRGSQVINLLFENSPIKKDDLAELYYQIYGVNKASIMANYFDVIKGYLVDDTYVGKIIEINEDVLDKLIEVVDNKPLVFLEDIQNIVDIEPSIVTLYLNQLDFKKYSNYYISDEYKNTTELFEYEIFNKYEILDSEKIDSRIWNLSSFSSQLYKKIHTMDLVEFDNNKFITINKLNDINLTKEIFYQFRKKTKALLQNNEFWSLSNILEVLNTEEIEKYGFNEIFYYSLLRGCNNLYNHRIGNNYLFKLNETVSLQSFLSYLIKKHKIVNIFELLIEIKEDYEINIEKHKVVEVIKKLGMYYDDIMEKIYLDIDYYYEEFL
jgi:DNA-directed RNA polymerase alpha subunit